MFLYVKPNTFVHICKYAYIQMQERGKEERSKNNENENAV